MTDSRISFNLDHSISAEIGLGYFENVLGAHLSSLKKNLFHLFDDFRKRN